MVVTKKKIEDLSSLPLEDQYIKLRQFYTALNERVSLISSRLMDERLELTDEFHGGNIHLLDWAGTEKARIHNRNIRPHIEELQEIRNFVSDRMDKIEPSLRLPRDEILKKLYSSNSP